MHFLYPLLESNASNVIHCLFTVSLMQYIFNSTTNKNISLHAYSGVWVCMHACVHVRVQFLWLVLPRSS